MGQKQFKLPDLGEGLTEGEILRWMVAPGDTVTLNQPIVEVETAKAAVEVPSPYAGTVAELLQEEGDTVDVGTPIITFEVDGEPVQRPDANPKESAEAALDAAAQPTNEHGVPPEVAGDTEEGEPGLIGGPAPGGRTSVLVGYGPRSKEAKRRPRKTDTATPEPPERMSGEAVATNAEVAVLAKPPVRKLAKDLGVDLRTIDGTGPGGTVTREDVQSAAEGGPAAAGAPVRRRAEGPREERIPIKGVRKHMAAAMVSSAFSVPHVTEFTTVDVTETMAMVQRLAEVPGFADVRVSPLLLVAKALLAAVGRHPMVNSTWDDEAQEIIVHHYVNLGIAAATERGLIVPNVKDADQLSLVELARALRELARTARAGKTTPADMQGGTITITNVGVFGVDNGTPIINPGESAILCFGAVRDMPWVHEGELAIRKVTQLALSFDHRHVDGQLGSEFLADVAAMLADPALLLAWS